MRRTINTKDENGELIVELPKKTVIVDYIKFTEEERDFYDSTYKQNKTKFDKFVGSGTVLRNYHHVFELILRLR